MRCRKIEMSKKFMVGHDTPKYLHDWLAWGRLGRGLRSGPLRAGDRHTRSTTQVYATHCYIQKRQACTLTQQPDVILPGQRFRYSHQKASERLDTKTVAKYPSLYTCPARCNTNHQIDSMLARVATLPAPFSVANHRVLLHAVCSRLILLLLIVLDGVIE